MSESINHPGQERTSDEVEGHRFRGGAVPPESTEDDTEGHRWRGGLLPQEPDESVEGHSIRGRG